MNRMMKMLFAALLALALPAVAMAEGPVLLVELPQDIQMIDNVEFDGGDFIQAYQTPGGMYVDLLRYSAYDMTAMDIAGSDWAGNSGVTELAIGPVGGCPTTAVRLTTANVDDEALDVAIVVVDCGEQSLIFQAIFPQAMGQEAIDAQLETMLSSLNVLEEGAADETAEVG